MQENIIGKYLISNDKIQWEYGNSYTRSYGRHMPLTRAKQEIKIGSFLFDIWCSKKENGFDARIIIRKFREEINKRWQIDRISLDNVENMSTDIIYDTIINWLNKYKQNVVSEITKLDDELMKVIVSQNYRQIDLILANEVMSA